MSRITIVGSGVVGRATGKGFIEHGNDVTFVDVDELTIGQPQGTRLHVPSIRPTRI